MSATHENMDFGIAVSEASRSDDLEAFVYPEVLVTDEADPTTRLVTGTEAATLADVALNTICNWRDRGYLVKDGLDEKGRPRYARKFLEVADRDKRGRALYRLLDVARAEKATRRNSGRRSAAA